MNLLFALFWLVIAAGLFLWPIANPATQLPQLYAWFALLLGGFNVARWFLLRRTAREQRQRQEELRQLRREKARSRRLPEPDPTFDFRDRRPSDP
jgi:hypothetical protein